MESIWMLFSRLLCFATPIFYSSNNFNLATLNLLNPMHYFIEFARQALIYQNLAFNWTFFGMFFYSALFMVLGLFIFSKLKRRFTELL
jgi:ABC-type polysaccharide/polyol phosphate export permease